MERSEHGHFIVNHSINPRHNQGGVQCIERGVSVGKKYIIELLDDCQSEFKGILVFGLTQEKQISVEPITEEDLTPYTEPDTESIRKEAYQQGHKDGYNKHDTERIRKQGYDKGLDDLGNALRLLLFQYSNYTLQELFGYDTARAVVEHYEGSEIVARIRCYEGGVKQDAETIRKEAYDKAFEDAEQVAESGKRAMYQKGLKDAWEATRKIRDMSWKEQKEVFGTDCYADIIALSVSEAIEKIRQYEQEKEEQIQVGDEVIPRETEYDTMIVTRLWKGDYDSDCIDAIGFDGRIGSFLVSRVSKTGKHYEIAEVFAKMKEANNG